MEMNRWSRVHDRIASHRVLSLFEAGQAGCRWMRRGPVPFHLSLSHRQLQNKTGGRPNNWISHALGLTRTPVTHPTPPASPMLSRQWYQ